MKAKMIDLIVTKVGAVAFMVTAYFIVRPSGWLPIVAVGAGIFIVGLPISVSVWQQQIAEIIKAKSGAPPTSGA